MQKNKKTVKIDPPWFAGFIDLIGAKSVREMTVEEYEQEFGTTFPDSSNKAADTQNPLDRWTQIAIDILERDFIDEPIDLSNKKCFLIGLSRRSDPVAMEALAKLQNVQPVRWTKRDLKEGRLLPRRKRISSQSGRVV